jgi:D-glycero-alpha-D-manno-heptose-7-phosphate kinase
LARLRDWRNFVVITKTPYRVSFLGGGTDFPEYYNKYGGAVLSATINKYSYVSVRKLTFHKKIRIISSEDEIVDHRDDLMNIVARKTLKYLGIEHEYEIYHGGELPDRSGMGASSVFCVGLLKAFMDMSNSRLAETAIYIERDLMGYAGGDQDQVAAAYGGFNVIRFPGTYVTPVRENGIFKKLMLFHTGVRNKNTNIIETYDLNHPCLHLMRSFAEDGIKYLNSDHDSFGDLLNTAWIEKRQLSDKISNPVIDVHYDTAMKNGALGGKLLGAGGGGFLLFYVPVEKQEQVKKALGLLHVPIDFEPNGSQIIYKEGT